MAGPSVRRAAVAVDAVCGRGSAGEDSAAAAGEGSHAEFASVLGLRVPEFPPAPRRMCDWTCELGGSACIEFALFLSVRVLLSFIFCIFQCSHTAASKCARAMQVGALCFTVSGTRFSVGRPPCPYTLPSLSISSCPSACARARSRARTNTHTYTKQQNQPLPSS